MFRVIGARAKYNVPWPTLYATKSGKDENKFADEFNCYQRAHQQSLELLPAFLVSFFIAQQVAPNTAVHAGLVFAVGRLIYGFLYSTFGAAARHPGTLLTVMPLWVLTGLAIKVAVEKGLGVASLFGPLVQYIPK